MERNCHTKSYRIKRGGGGGGGGRGGVKQEAEEAEETEETEGKERKRGRDRKDTSDNTTLFSVCVCVCVPLSSCGSDSFQWQSSRVSCQGHIRCFSLNFHCVFSS